ncbi:MAG: prepilin-type N-terminal cleavage/methylation domain-containing protein [Oligoflexia bacterium]|nr:prepilin-type N-terminal cleavage/methylation domain-containing protein [Oligoflexia bacterium]
MRSQRGFTLLELLITMSIVLSLAAIAIPQYADYRRRAFDIRALNDLRNIATAEEVYFLDTETYLSCVDADCEELPGIAKLSQGVSVQIQAQATAFAGSATHPKGTGKIFEWDSEQGGLLNPAP